MNAFRMIGSRDTAAGPIDPDGGIAIRAQRPDLLGCGSGFLEVELLAAGAVIYHKRHELGVPRAWCEVVQLGPGDLAGADTWRLSAEGFPTSIRVEIGPVLAVAQ